MPTVSAAFGMLADRARAKAPPRPEQEDLEDDHDDDHGHRDRALVQEHLEDPADERDLRSAPAVGGTG